MVSPKFRTRPVAFNCSFRNGVGAFACDVLHRRPQQPRILLHPRVFGCHCGRFACSALCFPDWRVANRLKSLTRPHSSAMRLVVPRRDEVALAMAPKERTFSIRTAMLTRRCRCRCAGCGLAVVSRIPRSDRQQSGRSEPSDNGQRRWRTRSSPRICGRSFNFT